MNPNKHKDRYQSIRTDLALESHEIAREESHLDEIEGVKLKVEELNDSDIKLTWVEIYNQIGIERMGKPIGNYITIESESMKVNDKPAHEKIIKIVSEKLGAIHNLKEDATVLIIGLGNWNVTPDALGPKVVSKVLITRHIRDSISEDIRHHVRSVSALAPGVMGTTGIETAETVRGLVDRVQPDLVIAIDALATRRTSRINTTIQISDTGISPGSGMGNYRMMLNKETLGVNVIGIGVPTVVDAATLVNDTMDLILNTMIEHTEKGAEFYETLKHLEDEEKYSMIKELLDPYVGNMFVTPKEVDEVIENLSNIIADSLNIALHPGIDTTDIHRFIR